MSLFAHYLSLPYLLEGIEVTLQVTALGLLGGLILGLILAWMQLSRFWWLAAFARGYTVIFRGTPLILQMVFAYDALPHIGIKLPAIIAAGLALACNEAPFIAEMLRSGVLGVDRGQVSAGQALGMTPSVLMRRVIAPQAIRTMIPAFGNESVSALEELIAGFRDRGAGVDAAQHATGVLDLRFLLDLLCLRSAVSAADQCGQPDPAVPGMAGSISTVPRRIAVLPITCRGAASNLLRARRPYPMPFRPRKSRHCRRRRF